MTIPILFLSNSLTDELLDERIRIISRKMYFGKTEMRLIPLLQLQYIDTPGWYRPQQYSYILHSLNRFVIFRY